MTKPAISPMMQQYLIHCVVIWDVLKSFGHHWI